MMPSQPATKVRYFRCFFNVKVTIPWHVACELGIVTRTTPAMEADP
jgi:hypothetical protein